MCHPPAVVLHGRLIASAHSASSFALALVHTQFQSVPLSPRLKKNKMLHAVCGADLKNENSRSGRVQSVSSPPVDGQSPSSFVESSLLPAQFPPRKPRLRRSVARGGACLRARASRLSIAAPPLLPKKMVSSLDCVGFCVGSVVFSGLRFLELGQMLLLHHSRGRPILAYAIRFDLRF